jgi:hypothetical protein
LKNLKLLQDRLLIFLIVFQTFLIVVPNLIFIQAFFSIVIGVYYAFKGKEVKVISIISFITGSEIYYKMLITHKVAIMPWEFPKYAALVICIILFTSRSLAGSKKYYTFSLIIYVLLICISFIYSIFLKDVTFTEIKSILGFYALGPLALGATILAFDNVKMSAYSFKKIIIYYFAGILPSSIFLLNNLSMFVAAQYVAVDSNKEFAGYGPIHVSLGLSFMVGLFLLSLIKYRFWKQRKTIYLLTTFFIIVMVLTFSRSGVYAVLPSVLVATHYKIKNFKKILIYYCFGIFSLLFIYVSLNNFTDNSLKLRYTQEETDPRFYLMKTDIEAWFDHPIFGVGFGNSKKYRGPGWGGMISHNEITRFLAEQGIFGLFCLLIIVVISIDRLKKGKNNVYMPFILFLIIFSFLYFNANAFRTYLPGFATGLAFIRFNHKQELFT